MEDKHNKHEAEEKINYIYQVLQHIGHAEQRSGFHYIVWGTAIALAMIVHYVLIITGTPRMAGYSWIGITLAASVLSVAFYLQKRKESRYCTNERSHTSSLSVIFHTFLFILLYILHQAGMQSIPVVFMVYGAWLLATGSIIRFRPFIWGGVLNWAMALSAMYISLPHQLFLGALVCLLSYTLPGYLLNKRTL